MDDSLSLLEQEYCPPIDPSLFSAIASDYDQSSYVSVGKLRAALDVLRESALVDEAAAFDPSGSSGFQDDAKSQGSFDCARSWHGDGACTSEATEDADFSGMLYGLEGFDLNNGIERGGPHKEQYELEMERLSFAEKLAILHEMFPGAKEFDIKYILKKGNSSFGKAVEELLNHTFLEEESVNGEGRALNRGIEEESVNGEGRALNRGIEAFTLPTTSIRSRKRREKKGQLLRRTSSTPAPLSDSTCNRPPPLSRWDRVKEDIEFISQRTFILPGTISSVYHKSGASLPSSIAALCTSAMSDPNSYASPHVSSVSPSNLKLHVDDLAFDFPTISASVLKTLVQLTYPSTASAHELARALISTSISSDSVALVPQYLPRAPSPPSATPTPPSSVLLTTTTTALANTRSQASIQAQNAYRKSKSKPLMSGAASYYSSVSRDASASLRSHEAAVADALVAGHSRPGEVDLHGVTVRDAVRIARVEVESWWEAQGREWAREGKAKAAGLRVVTGVGRHSESGKGKLGPAVGGMLVREGWKVEIGEGVIEVAGRVRR